ncbi:MAG: OsmC family protein [Candidatus Odinarchaeota archaeon]|nr:OsmC family protein [Candidatus Odinarchaeota archaeon]
MPLKEVESEVLKYHAYVKWRGNVQSEVTIRHFNLVVDTKTDGNDEGPNPTEVLLAAIGGCMIVNYGRLSRKMNLKIESIEIDIDAERPKMKAKVTKIKYKIRIRSNESYEKIERLKELVERNGTVFNTIKEGTEIVGNLEVVK